MQAARAHAVGLESSAREEMAAADEAFMLLGDAQSTVSAPPPLPKLSVTACLPTACSVCIACLRHEQKRKAINSLRL